LGTDRRCELLGFGIERCGSFEPKTPEQLPERDLARARCDRDSVYVVKGQPFKSFQCRQLAGEIGKVTLDHRSECVRDPPANGGKVEAWRAVRRYEAWDDIVDALARETTTTSAARSADLRQQLGHTMSQPFLAQVIRRREQLSGGQNSTQESLALDLDDAVIGDDAIGGQLSSCYLRIMRVWSLSAPGLEHLNVEERPEPVPGPGEVVVHIKAVSLNYRDLMVATGRYSRGARYRLVPLSDGTGEIAAIGSGVKSWGAGDRVATSFSQGG